MEWAEVIETSPRLGIRYREFMSRRLRYRGTDYDRRAHQSDLRIDLQRIDLPDNSLDVVLSSHVLEHVPDTHAALAELRRVVAPGGVVVLQVPLAEPSTIPPPAPEFHGDDTPVFWRFGWDLGGLLTEHGFEVTTHLTESMASAIEHGRWDGPMPEEIDLDAIVAEGRDTPTPVTVSVDQTYERALGFDAGWGLVTWTARVPGHATPRCAPTLETLVSRRRLRSRVDRVRHPGGHPLERFDGVEPQLSWGEAAAPLIEKSKQSLGPLRPLLRSLHRRVLKATGRASGAG